jgi:Lrp/AsnC family leucine-responsive transcriptional regulator
MDCMSEFQPLDRLDRAILEWLQRDGRATFETLGTRVGLSASAVLRRVHRLEAMGVIERYAALLRAERLGLGLTAYVQVRLEKQPAPAAHTPMEAFRASVAAWPEVVECVALAGEVDVLLKLVVPDMAAYSRFMMDALLRHPSVQDCKTGFVIDRIKGPAEIPLSGLGFGN